MHLGTSMLALLALLGVAGRTALAAQPFSHGWDTPKVMPWLERCINLLHAWNI